jgi:tRNA/rRNA methyltransferase
VFGREDFGLSNTDVEQCDMLCTIPTAESYRSMNLSHAVGVALYEMTRPEHASLPAVSMVKAHEKDTLYAAWWQLTGQLAYPQHRRKQSLQMIRRVIGRAGITSWEYHRFMGLLSRALKANRAWPIRRDELPDVSDWADPVEGDVDEDV